MLKTPREKALLAVTVLLFFALVAKSLYFDPQLGRLDPKEQAFVGSIETLIDENYRSKGLYTWGIIQMRVVHISDATKTQLKNAQDKGVTPMYPYAAKARKYLLWIIPIGEMTLMK